jgi:hypothetical protein
MKPAEGREVTTRAAAPYNLSRRDHPKVPMATKPGDPDHVKKAVKIPEQFERLARKYAVKIPEKRLEQLRQLRDSGTIQSGDLPATLAREFPGELAGMSLDELRRLGGKKS